MDALQEIAEQEFLKAIDILWDKVATKQMESGDVLNIKFDADGITYLNTDVHSVKEGLDWLSSQYQTIEAKMYGEGE